MDIEQRIDQVIIAIDHLINHQLNIILHHPSLQKLEASWRGLDYLVSQAENTRNVKIKLLDISWNEVVKDISRALDFDQSQLFQKIYSEEYGTPGGEPYGSLLGDYTISHRISKHHPDDIATLQGIGQIAAAAFAPFITAASSELFGVDNFSELRTTANLDNIFAQTEYTKWNTLRNKEDSRFVGLALPRILMRRPYRTTPGNYKGIFFYEYQTNKDQESYLWGNACYAFGSILIREFSQVGWFGHIRGVPRDHLGGGLLYNLPMDYFKVNSDLAKSKPATELVITDNMEKNLSNLGFLPLCQCYDLPYCAFYNNQSIQKPKSRGSDFETTNAKLSAMLQHVLCASRVAHYIKVIFRDKVGSFLDAEACERYLLTWLHQYTSDRNDMDWSEQSRYPLRQASVKIREHPEKPGFFWCIIKLMPHYQLDNMVSELELSTELTQAG